MSWRDAGLLPIPPKAFYTRLDYYHARHHERYRRYVETHSLMCQECGGEGKVVDDLIDFGGDDVGAIMIPMYAPCGWCEGTGKITRHQRGLWLRVKREEKRWKEEREHTRAHRTAAI